MFLNIRGANFEISDKLANELDSLASYIEFIWPERSSQTKKLLFLHVLSAFLQSRDYFDADKSSERSK